MMIDDGDSSDVIQGSNFHLNSNMQFLSQQTP